MDNGTFFNSARSVVFEPTNLTRKVKRDDQVREKLTDKNKKKKVAMKKVS